MTTNTDNSHGNCRHDVFDCFVCSQDTHPPQTLPEWLRAKLKKDKIPIAWVICWSVLKDQETIHVSFGRQLDYSSGFYKEVNDNDS